MTQKNDCWMKQEFPDYDRGEPEEPEKEIGDMPKKPKIRLLSNKEMNMIRGKASVGHASPDELMSVFAHIDQMETLLDECDDQDMLGTEGWRHRFSHPDAD